MSYDKLKEKWVKERNAKIQRAAAVKQRLIKQGQKLFEKYKISKVVLFGSVEAGSCGPDSDIDLYVEPLAKTKYWDFLHEIQELLEVKMDLYTESDNQDFVEKIIARGEVIYEVQS